MSGPRAATETSDPVCCHTVDDGICGAPGTVHLAADFGGFAVGFWLCAVHAILGTSGTTGLSIDVPS